MNKSAKRKILFIIPARQGSRGVPGKNIALVGGIPCLGRAILACKDAMRNIDGEYTIFCSTNSNSFKAVAESYGAYVPFLRPQELASDRSSTLSVIRHTLQELGMSWNFVVTVQCTVPFTSGLDIQAALAAFERNPSGTLVSVKRSPPAGWTFDLDRETNLMIARTSVPYQRQASQVDTVDLNGAIYIATPKHLMENGYLGDFNTKAFVMPDARSVDIDEPFDLKLCRAIAHIKVRARDANNSTNKVLCLGVTLSYITSQCQNLVADTKRMGYNGLRLLIDSKCVSNFPSVISIIAPVIEHHGLELHCDLGNLCNLNPTHLNQISSVTIQEDEIHTLHTQISDKDKPIWLRNTSLEISKCVLSVRELENQGFKNVKILVKIGDNNKEVKRKKFCFIKQLKGAIDGRVGVVDETAANDIAIITGTLNLDIYERCILVKGDDSLIDASNALLKFVEAMDILRDDNC